MVGTPRAGEGGWVVEGGEEAQAVREVGVFCFCSADMHSGPVPLPVTSLVPLHMACVHFQPEGPDIQFFKAQVLLAPGCGHMWGPAVDQTDGDGGTTSSAP